MTGPHFTLDSLALIRVARDRGVVGKRAIAKHIGVDQATFWAVRNGRPPSSSFIARLVLAFPDVPLNQVLHLVDDSRTFSTSPEAVEQGTTERTAA